jgi:hypothetical protein
MTPTAALNFEMILLIACGRTRDWRRNVALCVGVLALFISGLLSAPFTFLFTTPAYIMICTALIVMRRPPPAEWAWKIAALLMCLISFFASGLFDYYLGTVATAGRTPSAGIAWDQLLSHGAWLQLFRDHSLCQDPRLLLCIKDRGACLQIAGLTGAVVAIITRRGDIRTVAWTLIAYIGLVHLYAYTYQAGWLGPVNVLSNHFLLLSRLSFVFMFAVVPLFEPFRLITLNASADAKASNVKQLASVVVNVALAALLIVIVIKMFTNPYGAYHYRPYQLITGAATFAALFLAVAVLRTRFSGKAVIFNSGTWGIGWRQTAALSTFPILALVHLSFGVRQEVPAERNASLRKYLRENASIEVGKPFRGYAATIWIDKSGEIGAGPRTGFDETARYIYGHEQFRSRYGETFTEPDLWRSKHSDHRRI